MKCLRRSCAPRKSTVDIPDRIASPPPLSRQPIRIHTNGYEKKEKKHQNNYLAIRNRQTTTLEKKKKNNINRSCRPCAGGHDDSKAICDSELARKSEKGGGETEEASVKTQTTFIYRNRSINEPYRFTRSGVIISLNVIFFSHFSVRHSPKTSIRSRSIIDWEGHTLPPEFTFVVTRKDNICILFFFFFRTKHFDWGIYDVWKLSTVRDQREKLKNTENQTPSKSFTPREELVLTILLIL